MTSPALILLRGAPGSGKTTVAEQLIAAKPNWVHFENDTYFKSFGEPYVFRPIDLPAANKWCEDAARGAITQNKVVVVSNNFIEYVEMAPYIEMFKAGIVDKLIIANCFGEYPSIHGEHEHRIRRMRERMENIPLQDILESFGVSADVMTAESLLGLVSTF